MKATDIHKQYTESRIPEIVLTMQHDAPIDEYKAIVAKGKELAVEIKQYRAKRSLDANAYLWVLLSKMANVLHTTKDELYLQVLERYGVFTHIVVKPNVVGRVMEEWRTVRELGEVKINGHTGVQLQCYFGSSTYNTKEMSVLVDGVVSECKELDIEVLTPEEIAGLKQDWGA